MLHQPPTVSTRGAVTHPDPRLLWPSALHTLALCLLGPCARGSFERWLGLTTIAVQTASGSSGAEMSIVDLMDFENQLSAGLPRGAGSPATDAVP